MNTTSDSEPIFLVIPVSYEQEEVIALHQLKGTPLGMVPDERAYMLGQARKQYPTCQILGADLDQYEGEWHLTLKVR